MYKSDIAKGAGDGVKEILRTPVRSAQKFTPIAPQNKALQLKLKSSLDELRKPSKPSPQKANTVAEIRPTRSKKKRAKQVDDEAAVMLHATPRPAADLPPSRRDARLYRLEEMAYRRWICCVWRRGRTRLAMISESLRRREEKVVNLEQQIICLKGLNKAECEKRDTALAALQHSENTLKDLHAKNKFISGEKTQLEVKLMQLLNLKAQNASLEEALRNRSQKITGLEAKLHNKKGVILKICNERRILLEKIAGNECEMISQKEQLNMQSEQITALTNSMELLRSANDDLTSELINEKIAKGKLEGKLWELEKKLGEMSADYNTSVMECSRLKERKWDKIWEKSKNLAQSTWVVLEFLARSALPPVRY